MGSQKSEIPVVTIIISAESSTLSPKRDAINNDTTIVGIAPSTKHALIATPSNPTIYAAPKAIIGDSANLIITAGTII
ncbi:hypothetical protein MCHI_003568 [Candidatus Magnetoovum chiemensis]|nr:hypothetical protein MCHI_003568 [Candidatus Magnetoovum chiemensis]